MKLLSWFVFISLIVPSAWSEKSNETKSLDQKIKAFDEFEQSKESYKKLRESDQSSFLNERKESEKLREKQLEEYLQQKAKEKKVKPEETPDYETYLLEKWERRQERAKAADKVAQIQSKARPGIKEQMFELREYDLLNAEKNRVPYKKRKLLGNTGKGGFSGGSPGGSGGSSFPYIPPPPSDDIPEFDNEIPPPPPPPPPLPMGGGDFDEGEPMPIPPPPMPLE